MKRASLREYRNVIISNDIEDGVEDADGDEAAAHITVTFTSIITDK